MINPLDILIVALGSAIAQIIDLVHDIREKGKFVSRHSIRIAAITLTVVGAGLSANNALSSYTASQPRIIAPDVAASLRKSLSLHKGYYVQIVGNGLVDYTETCNLVHQLSGVFRLAGWHVIFGQCNRYPDRTYTTTHSIFDARSQADASAVVTAMSAAGWNGLNDAIRAQPGELTVMDIPFHPALRGRIGLHTVDLIIEVYDKQR